MSRLALVIGFTVILATPVSAGWRDQKIDGSTPRAFEQSVARLLNELPRRRREDLEIALAFIWLNNTVAVSGDLKHDGDVEYHDVRLLQDAADELLSAIERGDLLAAIEGQDVNAGDYTSVQYLKQLDGLQFDEVVSLAGKPMDAPLLEALRQEARCRESTSQAHIEDLECDRAGVEQLCDTCIRSATAKAFNTAIQAIQLQQYAEARTTIEALDFSRLSPYGRSKGQQILAQISYAEQDYSSTREHLQQAIDAGGLDTQQASEFRRQIDLLDVAGTAETND